MGVILKKWGNSVGVRLPKPMLDQIGLKEGSEVEIAIEGGRLIIRPRRETLAELLAQCRPENRPEPVDWGPPVGRELL